ncbi:hypothetical protein [Winogradskyella aurantiaca]|uniref:hypothetical protein n=1 Tax=Winogradskyella aurantiaca TaxID=2219558 RepID=UPI000E1D0C92|nr:hypothetical protein [Winogradskyella aurantiaca]
MNINLLIKLLLVLIGFTFIGLQAFQWEIAGSGISALMLIGISVLYKKFSKFFEKQFFLFLLFFTLAEIIGFVYWFIPVEWLQTLDFTYYGANLLYITAYIFLIMHVLNGIEFRKMLKRFAGPAVILLILDIFCVYIVTDTAGSDFSGAEYILEFSYNGVIMVLLSVALLNYLYKDTNKAMLFLIGAIFIVFSEIIQMAYFYIVDSNDLSATYATFLVMAFLFLYIQSQFSTSKSFSELQDEKIKVS